MRALVVVNPTATATTPPRRNALVRTLGEELKLDVAETAYRGHGLELGRRAVEDGVDVVVALGGDGTVNEVVNGLLHDGPGPHLPLLAVVPGGSTNVFSRALGRSRNPARATEQILAALREGRTRRISLGRASATGTSTAPVRGVAPSVAAPVAQADAVADEGWSAPRWFVFAAGLGFDAEVIARVEARRAAGRRSTGRLYLKETTLAFLLGHDRRRPAMSLQIPGRPTVDELFLCLVCNVSPWTYLGPRAVNPCPEASFDTDLDVFALGRLGSLRMLRTFGQTLAPWPRPRGRGVHRWHGVPEVALTSDRPLGWQLDGDHLGTATGLRLGTAPGVLRVVA